MPRQPRQQQRRRLSPRRCRLRWRRRPMPIRAIIAALLRPSWTPRTAASKTLSQRPPTKRLNLRPESTRRTRTKVVISIYRSFSNERPVNSVGSGADSVNESEGEDAKSCSHECLVDEAPSKATAPSPPSLTPAPNLYSAQTRMMQHQHQISPPLSVHHNSSSSFHAAFSSHHFLPAESVYESAAKLLFMSIKWAKSVPSFLQLHDPDQTLLLEDSWAQLFVIGLAQWGIQFEDGNFFCKAS